MFLFSRTAVASEEAAVPSVLESFATGEVGWELLCARSIGVEGRDGVAEAGPMSCTLLSEVYISSSVKSPNGSRLLRIVPVNSVGSVVG
jgi:hypothetical protein